MPGDNDTKIETNSKVVDILKNLKSVIDNLHDNFTSARELIIELARLMNEERLCETGQICIAIKKMLEDKIKKGKITARWIEGCLDKEYKRKYAKSEESSLLRTVTNSEPQTSIVVHEVDENNDTISSLNHGIDPSGEVSEFNSNEELTNSFSNDEQAKKIIELEQALLESSKLRRANELEEQFEIPKTKQAELDRALENCIKVVLVKFDEDNKLKSIYPDSSRIENEDFIMDDNADDNDK